MLARLRSGEIVIESTPDREVGLMFTNLDELVPRLVTQFDWRFYRIPFEAGELVLPDVGVTMYDPTPKLPLSGAGLASSPNSEIVLHLAPDLAVVVRPGTGRGDAFKATVRHVEALNMRAVANSDRCIYGCSRELVESVLASAAADPDRVEALRPRPGTLWIAEGEGEPQPGPINFTGYSLAGTVEETLYVSREGIEEARTRVSSLGSGRPSGGRTRRRRRRVSHS